MKKNILVLVLLLITGSCATKYRSVAFNAKNLPKGPNYTQLDSWAALPGHYPEALTAIVSDTSPKRADVFYIYPTLLTDKKDARWNSDIWDSQARSRIKNVALKYQASAWAEAANVYAPFYRQAHYRIFQEPYTSQGIDAWEVAYNDIRSAFEYYLANYNEGKPIIIAAHSQGSMHAIRLLQEFFDGKPLQRQLVAAYLPGTTVHIDDFKTIKHMSAPDEVGGFVSWNSFKMKHWPKNYSSYFKGSYSTNPISWDTKPTAPREAHRGVLFTDDNIYDKSLRVETKDGILWVSLPKIPKRLFLFWVKNYHYADVNLFWGDISYNASQRIKNWFKLNAAENAQ